MFGSGGRDVRTLSCGAWDGARSATRSACAAVLAEGEARRRQAAVRARTCSPPTTARSTARRRLQVKAALLGALAYFVLPADAMPDILPMLGYTDDALVLVTALRMVSGHIRDEHREAARQALARELDDVR